MGTSAATEAGLRAGRREWIGLAVLALPTALMSMDITVLFLALPHLSADLGASSVQQLWITDIYGFMVAGFLVTMGTLGDRIGRRRLLLIGVSAFGATSVLAAYSTSAGTLTVARALMGIAGATLLPSTLALISNMFRDARQQGVAIAVWLSCFMAGAALGPVVGGAMLASFWWGSVFLLSVPVMLVLLVTAPRLLPEYRAPQAGRLDLVSVVLSLATILPVVYGLKELARNGWRPLPIAVIVVGAAIGVVFARRQRGLADPLLDLRLFGNRSFTIALVTGLVVGAVQSGTGLFVALHLQMVEGLSPLAAGLWLVPPAAALVLGINLAPHVARRIRPAYVLAAGLAVSAIGQLLLTQVDSGGGVAVLVLGLSIVFVGVGPAAALINQLVLGSAPPEKAGSAVSVSATSGDLGVALGIAVLGSVGAAVYHSQMANAVPAGVSASAAATARESIAGAVAAAGQLPAAVSAELLQVARAAFTSGLNIVAVVSAVLLVGLAAFGAAGLRHMPPMGDAPAHGDEADPTERPAATAYELAEPDAGAPANP